MNDDKAIWRIPFFVLMLALHALAYHGLGWWGVAGAYVWTGFLFWFLFFHLTDSSCRYSESIILFWAPTLLNSRIREWWNGWQ